MARTYPKQRDQRTPPHVSLRSLRIACGLTLDKVAENVTVQLRQADVLRDDEAVSRGTISAIETGLRGASQQMLDAIAVSYGLEPGDLTVTYEARERAEREAVPA